MKGRLRTSHGSNAPCSFEENAPFSANQTEKVRSPTPTQRTLSPSSLNTESMRKEDERQRNEATLAGHQGFTYAGREKEEKLRKEKEDQAKNGKETKSLDRQGDRKKKALGKEGAIERRPSSTRGCKVIKRAGREREGRDADDDAAPSTSSRSTRS